MTKDNVWNAICETPGEALAMTIKSSLMRAINNELITRQMTQVDLAKKLEITQPRLNELLRGKIDKFSVEWLPKTLPVVGLTGELTITKIESVS